MNKDNNTNVITNFDLEPMAYIEEKINYKNGNSKIISLDTDGEFIKISSKYYTDENKEYYHTKYGVVGATWVKSTTIENSLIKNSTIYTSKPSFEENIINTSFKTK